MCHQVDVFLGGYILSMSRCDFFDFLESRLNTDKAEFTLRNFIALFVPGIGLTVGKVTRIIRTLKASTSFPILHVVLTQISVFDFVRLPNSIDGLGSIEFD